MPRFQKGVSGNPAGRQKGSKNRTKYEVAAEMKKLGCNPFEGMVIVATRALESGELNVAGNMYRELARYLAPQLKAVELTTTQAAAIIQVVSGGPAGAGPALEQADEPEPAPEPLPEPEPDGELSDEQMRRIAGLDP